MIIISDIIFDHVSVLQSNISLNDITFQMNERSSFCSLLQLVWNVWWSQCRSHRANFWLQCTTSWFTRHTLQAGYRAWSPAEHSFGWTTLCTVLCLSKPNSCPRGQKGQVQLEALWRCYGGAPEARNSRNHGYQVSKTVFHKYGLYSFSTTPT